MELRYSATGNLYISMIKTAALWMLLPQHIVCWVECDPIEAICLACSTEWSKHAHPTAAVNIYMLLAARDIIFSTLNIQIPKHVLHADLTKHGSWHMNTASTGSSTIYWAFVFWQHIWMHGSRQVLVTSHSIQKSAIVASQLRHSIKHVMGTSNSRWLGLTQPRRVVYNWGEPVHTFPNVIFSWSPASFSWSKPSISATNCNHSNEAESFTSITLLFTTYQSLHGTKTRFHSSNRPCICVSGKFYPCGGMNT